jgi:hypothetical protein
MMALTDDQCKCGLAFLASRIEHVRTTNHLYEPNQEMKWRARATSMYPNLEPSQPLVINFTVEQLEKRLTVGTCHLGIEGSTEQRVQRYARARR